ncbi:MAG: MOSC domain-containing protein [Bdellovibrionaceae bacterium]|nr:MOSC domain-containing protein [Pseudobdellovibrionaceae bacterium]
MQAQVASLHIYPIKSCKGISVDQLEVNDRGPLWDRNWVLVSDQGQFLSQRQFPELSQVEVFLEEDYIKFGLPSMGYLKIPIDACGEKKEFQLWGEGSYGYEVSAEASEWFSAYLKSPCHFLSSSGIYSRKSSSKRSHSSSLVYADGFPFLVVSQASLDLLNKNLENQNIQVEMSRFRPNIVLTNLEAHQEDQLGQFKIGELKFQAVKDCPRCVIVNIDPDNSNVNPKVFKTLAKYRKKAEGIVFGQNLVHFNSGRIKVGDKLYTY